MTETLKIPVNNSCNEQVSIIVMHHDRPDYLNICLQSIHAMSNFNNWEVIVVDNASGQETQDYLDVLEAEGVKVVRNKQNNYWSKAANQGVAVADPNSRFFIFMHCDTVVLESNWIDVLINLSIGKNAGLVGTQMQQIRVGRQEVDFIPEWCIMMTRECWDDIGPWPEDLPIAYMSFIMTLRAQFKGHKPLATGYHIVHHYRAMTLDPNEYDKFSEQAYVVLPKLIQQAQSR